MTSERRPPAPRRSPMLHTCSVEGCTTIVFGHGPCVEHDRPRVPLRERLLAEAVAAAKQQGGEENAEAAAVAETTSEA